MGDENRNNPPSRFRNFLSAIRTWAGIRYAILARILGPCSLILNKLCPEACLDFTPDRYSINLKSYKKSNGLYSASDIRKFTAGNIRNNGGDFSRFYFLNLVIDQILKEGIKGDIAELGVYKGNSAFLLRKLAEQVGQKAYLFDTYEGFDPKDMVGIDSDKDMQFSNISLQLVKKLIGERNAVFVKGYFPGSTSLIPSDLQFSLVHIDCDLYAPFNAALGYFYPRMVTGGFIIMHDYSSLHWKGVETCIDDFFKDKPEFIVPIPDKSGSVVVRKV